ncbi:MAG: hypothetical protein ACYCTK_07005, partial [Acidithiobacillus ferrooxidans]
MAGIRAGITSAGGILAGLYAGCIETGVRGVSMCRAILPDYAELHCLSALSFLRGASAVEDLLDRAQALGYRALAITEECSLG